MRKLNEKTVIRKIFWRVVPLLMVLYVISFIDRINVGFAALTMNKDIGLTPYMFGWGAGIFFFGYFIFEVPSNMMMVRIGARRWIARILLTWGICAIAMALVTGPTSFCYRARIVSAFMLSIPVSVALGAPLSTVILEINGVLGLKGWQWLFIVEGLPALFGTFVVLGLLTDRPEDAHWLDADERVWLKNELAADDAAASSDRKVTGLRQALSNPAVLLLSFVYFCAIGVNLGLSFFLPQIIKQQGYSTITVGLITSIPYIAGCAGMLVIGHLSDRFDERRWFLAFTMVLAAGGLALAGMAGESVWSIVALSVAAIGIFGCKGPFWTLPAAYLRGPAAAGGIAFINAIGNLGGFAGPYLVGLFKRSSDSYANGLYALAAMGVAALVVTVVFIRPRRVAAPASFTDLSVRNRDVR
jgi:ACS family tartrate transporter-like MFS transporter